LTEHSREWEGRAPVKLAIVGPSFFSYVEGIAEEFRRRGFETAVFDERHSNRLVDKILYRLGLYRNRFSPKRKHLAGIVQSIEAAGCTDVLLADVEVVDRAFVDRLAAMGIRVHLYMWDAARNKPGFVSYLDLVSSRGSFDPGDAQTLDMAYIPLFAEPAFDQERLEADGDHAFDIGFCGTVHSSRTRILARLIDAGWVPEPRLALMLYYHSRALFRVKGLVDWNVWKLIRRIATTPYSKAQIAAMFARTRFVLDVPHPGQTGMTARTFEVLFAGSRLLTFNRRAAELLPASLQTRVHIVDSIDEVAAIDFGAFPRMPALTREERYFLSLHRFVDQLMAMMNILPQPQAPARDGASVT
jgi:hypothetical protein